MPSMLGFGSRRLMANPCTGDKCANATAAMQGRAGCAHTCRHAPRMRGMHYHEALQRNCNGRGLAAAPRHFALSAAAFLHSDMNFLRSLPWKPLVSASFEHSSDAAVRGFAAFFSAGAIGAVFAAGAGVAGAVVCANAELISSREATAAAAAREDIVIMEAPRVE